MAVVVFNNNQGNQLKIRRYVGPCIKGTKVDKPTIIVLNGNNIFIMLVAIVILMENIGLKTRLFEEIEISLIMQIGAAHKRMTK